MLCRYLMIFCLLVGSVFVAPNVVEAQEDKKHTNALVDETSPYLLMHAHNPVDWYPWGEEALAKAKKEDKPIFLSIGYSSCHWCHVMERESFLDEEIAKFLNEHFVCIKVDREERPDVDSIYMESLRQYSRGRSGGWPLSMFLTPEAKPFFGGTYFPARKGDRGARIGFIDIVKLIDEKWNKSPDQLKTDADKLTEMTKAEFEGRPPVKDAKIKSFWNALALDALGGNFDETWGGFGFNPQESQLPKFPEPSNLLFLADTVRRGDAKDESVINAKKMLVKTCEGMMKGGIYDHLGGGFHRYSVDRFWRIPHFEKMLYDNGQLAIVYTQVFEITEEPQFKATVEGILQWVSREMIDEKGGFYSALDAESEGIEGKYYRWEMEEIKSTLSPEQFQLAAPIYGFNAPPNFEKKYYAPQLSRTPAEIARSKGITFDELAKQVGPIRKALFDARSNRERPLLDNKILTSWNGLMIRGFADAGRVFKNQEYLNTAATAADFGLQKLVREDGRLWRTHTKGESKLNAYLDDYAFFIDGLLALHRADGEQKWLDTAVKIQAKQDELFWDETQGGYFFTSSDHEQLIIRSKRVTDRALPSGNSVAAGNLIYLAKATGDDKYKEQARKTVVATSGLLEQLPTGATRLLLAVNELLPPKPKTPPKKTEAPSKTK